MHQRRHGLTVLNGDCCGIVRSKNVIINKGSSEFPKACIRVILTHLWKVGIMTEKHIFLDKKEK